MIPKDRLIAALKDCFDPELQIDIWTLGLIYDLAITGDGEVRVKMTLTTPFCPYGPALMEDVEQKLKAVEGVKEVRIEIVFEPPWQPSDELRAMLGI